MTLPHTQHGIHLHMKVCEGERKTELSPPGAMVPVKAQQHEMFLFSQLSGLRAVLTTNPHLHCGITLQTRQVLPEGWNYALLC